MGSGTEEEVVNGAEVSDETARRLMEELVEDSEETERAPPASHSTPRTSPPLTDESPPVQLGYQQPDDPLNIRGGGAVDVRNRIEPVVVDHSACMSARQRTDVQHEELESKMDELLRRQEELHVRFAAAGDQEQDVSRQAGPSATPHPAAVASAAAQN